VHDITHLDALWGVADLILGPDYPMNPAEVYVLGMAFLIHDAATSSFAFKGGLSDVRETIEWKDYVSQQSLTPDVLVQGAPQFQIALFEALRMLHAKQAETLLTLSWTDLNGKDLYLVEDVKLRNHYGRVIGKIAGSHGEDPSVVETRWANVAPVSSHVSLELDSKANWTVDCLKVAMLLRCIDAAHIDALRAPDIEASLVVPSGVSRDHWIFQNRLSKIARNEKDELYWSAAHFTQDEANAWWRCYETCVMIDREIKAANRILSDNSREVLAVKGVMGIHELSVFQQNIPAEGWQPVDFDFKVSRVGNVIETFGGEKLYGGRPHLALKELLQNASDAIRARRAYIAKQSHGQIVVRLRQEDGAWWLDVEDDGIGMTHYVLSDVLLDFGRSLWKDSALRQQWRGLASRDFSAMGQFGIGFFSVFMLGDEVKVTTWPFRHAEDKQQTLHLRNRVAERPILLTPAENERLPEVGTRISIRLRKGRASLLRQYTAIKNYKTYERVSIEETLAELIGTLAPALDIDVVAEDHEYAAGGLQMAVVADDWRSISAVELLERLYPRLSKTEIASRAKHITDITEADGTLVGRAGLDFDDSSSEGVLVHRGVTSGRCEGLLGLLLSTNNSDLAREKAEPVASAAALEAWALAQLTNLDGGSPYLSEKTISLGVVSNSLVVGKIDENEVTIGEIIELLGAISDEEVIFLTDWPDCPDDMSKSEFEYFQVDAGVIDLTDCQAEERFDFGLAAWIEAILPEDSGPRTTIAALVHMAEVALGAKFEIEHTVRRIGSANGNEVEDWCLVLTKS
jgi:hypothetical protein